MTRRFRGPISVLSWLVAIALGLGATPLHAQKPGKPFKSPLKNFTVVVPELLFETKVQKKNDKDGGTVSFLGATGDGLRIDYTRLPTVPSVPTDSTELRAVYHKYLEALLLRPNPSCSLLHERDYTLDSAMMLLAVVSFPGGSHLQDMATGKRLDSVRGLLIFARGEFLYMLHAELAASGFKKLGDAPTEVDKLSSRAETFLTDFYRSITFL